MQRKPRLTISLALSTSVLCCTILTTQNVFARDEQEGAQRPAAVLSPEEVTVEILDWNAYQADALNGNAAVYESSWVHGSGTQLEGSGLAFTHYGYGSLLQGTGTKNKKAGWVHFAIPTPVVSPQKKPAKLRAVLLSVDVQQGMVDFIDVWDGSLFLVSKQVTYTGNHLSGSGLIKIEFPTMPLVSSGIGVSVHAKNHCNGDPCPLTVLFAAAGAELIR